jgi:hypothetical protein
MPEHDPQAFAELFASEPADASGSDAATWVDTYQRLIDMMERQLAETRAFAAGVHEPMQRYLGSENVAILEEEISAFKERLTHWTNREQESQ